MGPDAQTPETSTQDTAQDLEQSFESALSEHGIEDTGPSQETPSAPEAPTKGTPSPTEDPEHFKWAKSIEGDFDNNTGQFNLDRVIKRSYEVTKYARENAQKNAQLVAVLQHPEVRSVLEKLVAGQQPQETPQTEKTDEQIFREMVRREALEIIKQEYGPQISQQAEHAAILFHQHAQSTLELTAQQLREHFGKTDDGEAYLYDTVRGQIGQQIEAVAAQNGMDVNAVLKYMVEREVLFPVMQAMAQRLLFPQLLTKLQTTRTQKTQSQVANQKRAQLTSRGTPATAVREKPREVNTRQSSSDAFEEAARLAEEQLGIKD